jgi:phosphatidylglycerophosphate synthase
MWLFAGAWLTDMLDGRVARFLKVADQQGKLGHDWIDPLGDALLALSALMGIVFHDDQWRSRLSWSLPMIVLVLMLKAFKQKRTGGRLYHFAYGILPLYEIASLATMLYVYCVWGLYSDELPKLQTIAPFIIIGFFWFGRTRLRDWWAHLRFAFATGTVNE